VHDFDAMRHFYVDLLGFAVEWEPDADNLYLSSGIDNLALHAARTSCAADRRRDAAAPAWIISA
jgi:catechol 2,3-dioxygenase-like lactoylglutathione lyase family enzyme